MAETAAKRPFLGLLAVTSKAARERYRNGISLGMRELGHVERRDYAIEERHADGNPNRLRILADELRDARMQDDLAEAPAAVGSEAHDVLCGGS